MNPRSPRGGVTWQLPGATGIGPEECAREIMETVPLVMRFIRSEMRRSSGEGLSVPQFRALAFLHRQPGASLSEVADHLGVTNPTASAIVDRLVRRGLLSRTAHPTERRRVVLALTPSGSSILEQAREATRKRVAALLAPMNPSGLRTLARGMALLRGVFEGVNQQDVL